MIFNHERKDESKQFENDYNKRKTSWVKSTDYINHMKRGRNLFRACQIAIKFIQKTHAVA